MKRWEEDKGACNFFSGDIPHHRSKAAKRFVNTVTASDLVLNSLPGAQEVRRQLLGNEDGLAGEVCSVLSRCPRSFWARQ
jgi:hypothetical protein